MQCTEERLLKLSGVAQQHASRCRCRTQIQEPASALLAHPLPPAEPTLMAHQPQKHEKLHARDASLSAKTWVLCVQEWFLSSRDRLKKSRVLARATCECSSRAPIVPVLLQLVHCATCTAPRCSLHSSKGRPAWSPSMLLVAAVAAAAVAPPLSAPCSSSRAHCCRASKRARCRSRHTLAATQVLAKLCGALSAALSLHTMHSCCTFDASFLHPLQVLTLQSAVSSCPRDVL